MNNNPKILIVDDDANDLNLLRTQLVQYGYNLITAMNGDEALDAIAHNDVDLIILDVMIPGKDAFEVTRRLKADENTSVIPIILCTELIAKTEKEKGLEAGCDDFINKPLDSSELLARVRLLLKLKAYSDHMHEDAIQQIQALCERNNIEEQFRTLFEGSSNPITICDRDGNCLMINAKGAKNLGLPVGEIIGKSVRAFFPEIYDDLVKRFRKVIDQEEVLQFEEKVKLPTGEAWFWSTLEPVRDATGAPYAVQVISYNITDRKWAVDALRESKEKYSMLVEHATDGVVIIQDNVLKFVNKRMSEMSGYTIEELTGMPTLDLVPTDFIPELEKRFALREQGAEVSKIFYTKMLCKDGTVKEIENSTKLIQYEGRSATLSISRDITERKYLEERLRQEEHQSHALIEHSSDIIVLADRDGTIIYENPAIEKALGYKRDERIGGCIFDLVHPNDLEDITDIFNILKNDPHSPVHRSEIRLSHKDGSWCIVEATGSNLVQDNVVKSVIINMRDITRRKNAEDELQKYREHLEELIAERTKELQESEEKFRIIFNSIADGISVIDLATGKLIDSNPASLKMFNFTREDIIGHYSYELIAEKDLQRATEDIVRTLQTGDSGISEWCLLGKGGTEHDCEARASVIYDNSRKPLYLVNVMRDIGERKRASQALRESERRYRILAENVSDVILTLDMNLRFTYISPSGSRMPKLRELTMKGIEELPKTSIQDVLTTDSFQEAVNVFTKELNIERAGGADPFRSRRLEFQIMTNGEPDTWVEVKATFIRDHEGHPAGIMCIVRDITQSRKDEEARAELELKAQINSRLTSIGEMAAGIAHEINNPLTPIIGFVDLILKEDIAESIKSDLRIIRDCASQAADITKRLLTFARQIKPIRTQCNINEVVANTIQLIDYHLKTNNIAVVTEFDCEIPATTVDRAQLQQVLLNIIMNAEHEMKRYRGCGNLLIQTKNVNNMIRILIEDDGPGIPKENIGKIFQPFFTTKNPGEGTGLGLSICHGIIAEHNGRIFAQNEAGKGATFIVELPIISQEKEPCEPDTGIRPTKTDTVKSRARILVVDDEISIRTLLKRILADEGYEVAVTGQPEEALRLIKGENKYELILLDIKLPDMSGTELYQHLDKTDISLAKRIVFMTGDSLGPDTIDFLSQSKATCLHKPFSTEQLKTTIKNKLTQKE